MSHLGQWGRQAEALFYIVQDLHKMRPAVVGASCLVWNETAKKHALFSTSLSLEGFRESELRRTTRGLVGGPRR